MATTETVVFEVDISSYEKALAGITKSIGELQKEQKKLQAEAKMGSEESAIALERVNAELKIQQQEYRTTQAALVGYLASQKKGIDTSNLLNNSIQTNRDYLKQLTAQYIGLAKPSQALADKVKAVSDALKQQESAIGDNRRKVGDYTGGIIDAAKQLNIAGISIGGIIDPINNISKGFKDAGGGVNGLAAGLKGGLAAAVPLAGIAISGISKVLESYEPIAEAAENATVALKAGFTALVTGGDITEAARQAVEYTEALRDLEDTQAAFNLSQAESTNRVNQLLLTSKNVGLDIGQRLDILKEAAQVEKNQFAASKARINEEIKTNEKLIVSIGRLTEKQRIQLENGNEASKLEIRNLLAARGVEEEVINRFEQGLIQRANLEGQSIALREKLANRVSALTEKQDAENEKSAAKEKQRLEELAKAREAYLKNLDQLENQFLLNERQRLDKSFDDKLATIKGNGERESILRFVIEQERIAALEKFDAEAQAKLDAKAAEREAKRMAALSTTFNEAVALNKQITDNELLNADIEIANAQEKERKKQEILIASLRRQLELTQAFFAKDGPISQAQAEALENIELQIKAAEQKANEGTGGTGTFGAMLGLSPEQISKAQEGAQQAGQIVQGFSNLVNTIYQGRLNDIEGQKNAELEAIEQSGASEEEKEKRRVAAERKAAMETYEIQKEQFETNKAISIIQAIINTASAVIAQFSNPTPYVGIVLAALAAATGAAQIAVIAAQQPPAPPKFAGGVIGLNGPGTEKSDSIDAKLSKGESVVTAKATRRYHKQLAQMEASVGNTPNYNYASRHFATGVIGDGGFTTREITNQATDTAAIRSAIIDGFKFAPQQTVSVVEFNKKQAEIKRSVAVSEL
jgi:hypothetical protein